MTHLAYADSRNLITEALKVSAVARGMAHGLHEAGQRGILTSATAAPTVLWTCSAGLRHRCRLSSSGV
jgi:hypothetical protein